MGRMRRARAVDALLAVVLCAFLARVTASLGGTSGAEWAWFGALFVPLVWRRRWPVAVYWTVVVLAFAAATADAMGPAPVVVPMLAVYTLARHRPRRDVWLAMAAAVPFVAGWLWHGGPLWDALSLTAVFAASALLGAYLQTRRAYLAETERARLAREVHDIVAHNLAVMVALADGAVATAQTDPPRAADMMGKVASTGREALTEIRHLVGPLRDGQPGFDDIDGLVAQVRAAGLTVEVTREGTPGAWGPGAGLAGYRIVQEALTNTMKHAGPQAKAHVRLAFGPGRAEIEVRDDGGNGIAGMRERAAAFGGGVDAGPLPGGGWRVAAHLRPAEPA